MQESPVVSKKSSPRGKQASTAKKSNLTSGRRGRAKKIEESEEEGEVNNLSLEQA